MNLALFDFDGTLTERDSFAAFIRFAVGSRAFAEGLLRLSPVFLGYSMGVVSNNILKERVVDYFFGGWEYERFFSLAVEFGKVKLPRMLRRDAMKRIVWHLGRGDKVVVVSASLRCYLEGWCRAFGFDLIATRLEVDSGVITGRLKGNNCYGEEKAKKIRNRYNLSEYEKIYAYGNTRGDIPMLKLAHESYYRIF